VSGDSASALRGLAAGSFEELRAHLRAGGVVEGELAQALADIIDPSGASDWKASLKLRTKNRRTVARNVTDGWKRLEVGAWTDVWIGGHGRGQAQQIRHLMAEHFDVGETFVREALAHFRKIKGLWEGDHADYEILRYDSDDSSFDLLFAKECVSRAEDALKIALENCPEKQT
jgi:hypothetical protein